MRPIERFVTVPVALLMMSLAGSPGLAQQPDQGREMNQWLGQAARAWHQEDYGAWVEATEKLHEMRPYNQDFMTHLVKGYALLEQYDKAFDMMLHMQQQGLAQDWDEVEEVEAMREHGLYDHLNTLMKEAGEAFGEVEQWSELDDVAMPEGVTIDPETGRMLVGSIRDGRIVSSEDGGRWETFASPESVPELQAVFDLAVDSERGHLWVASGMTGQFRGEDRDDDVRSSLLRLDLASGELQREYPLSFGSGQNLIGSLAVTTDGQVFAADTQAPVIYRLEADGDELRPYFGHPGLTSLRGMALSGDDRLLYVADYELGILIVDTTDREKVWRLAAPETLNLGGIDGLYWWNSHLVAIQNGITPQRVLRLKLGDDGLGVTAVAPIVAAQESFDNPTFGAMNGPELYFLAGSHWHHVDARGNASGSLPSVPVLRVDVDNARVQVVGEEMLEQIKRRQQNR